MKNVSDDIVRGAPLLKHAAWCEFMDMLAGNQPCPLSDFGTYLGSSV